MTAELDRNHLAEFYARIPDRDSLSKSEMADMFGYYLQYELGRPTISSAELKACFRLSDLGAPSWLATYLTTNSKGKAAKYVKADKGYRLHARERDRLVAIFAPAAKTVQTSAPLRTIEEELPLGARREFLAEAVRCYEIGCNRAAVVMFWLFVLDHLYEFVMLKNLDKFNDVLSKNTDKRVKTSKIVHRDDFNDIPEGKFIEFLRSAGVISADVRKILDQKLGTRNTAAHPSTVKLAQSKANDFFDDLIENVIHKYPLA